MVIVTVSGILLAFTLKSVYVFLVTDFGEYILLEFDDVYDAYYSPQW